MTSILDNFTLENLPDEIIVMIQTYLDPISQSRLKRTNKNFNNIIVIQISRKEEKRKKRINRLRYFNPYFEFIQQYYDKIHEEEDEKEYDTVFESKCITWDILINKEYRRRYNMPNSIGKHPNVGWDIIKEYAKRHYIDSDDEDSEMYCDYEDEENNNKYYFYGQEKNPNITFDIIINNIPEYFYYWNKISSNKNITVDILLKYPNKPWDYKRLSENKNITIDYITKNLDKEWNWWYISRRAKWEDIQKYPNLPWNYEQLGSSKYITWDIIKSNPQIPWDFWHIGYNPNITLEIVKANPQYNWNYHSLNSAGVLTFAEVKRYRRRIDDGFIGYSKGVTLKDIEDNPNFPWDWWTGVSNNPNLTREFFEKHKDKEWNYTYVLRNLYGKAYKESYFKEHYLNKKID